MERLDKLPRKEFAWNGVSFLAPVSWEVGKIGQQYLMIEDDFGPVMELKWYRIKGKFILQDQLSHLAAAHKNKPGRTIRKIPIPSDWEKVIDGYDSIGFSWQGETIGGIGIILYCPKCRTSTLMQFFQRKAHITNKITTQLLASFQDHSQDGQVTWSLFDITAKIPVEFQLTRYSFKPGAFELVFACRKNRIILYRWSPASILLNEQDLLQTASKMFGVPQADLRYKRVNGCSIVDYNISPLSYGWARIYNIIRSNSLYCSSRIWHIEDKNRLLGVKMDGRRPIEPALFEQICVDYDSL